MLKFSFNLDLFNSYYFFYERLIITLFSLVPTLLLIGFVLYTDRKSKEPLKNIIICVFSGILTISLASYFEQLVMPYFSNNIVLTYVFAFIEEICKSLIFFLFIFDNKHYDDIYDGVVYMSLIALSFAGLENIMYAFSESTVSESINLAIMRDITTIPLHVICGIVIGYFLSLGNFSKKIKNKLINISLAIICSGLIHGTFNLLMTILGNINVNYNDKISVFFSQALPLILIMVVLFIIVFIVSNKAVILNDIFINNYEYSKRYSYLMTKKDYLNSEQRKRRVMLYDKLTIKHKNKDELVKEKIDDIFNDVFEDKEGEV